MAINRKQWLRYTGAAAAGAAAGTAARGLFCPDLDAPASLPPTRVYVPTSTPPVRRSVGEESFAQSGEDLIVAFTAAHLAISRVTYLDVGANDPVRLSNTFYFYKRGHRGVLVEPDPSLCDRLRKARPGDTVLEAGIGPGGAGEADYYFMTFNGLNTFSREEADHQAATSNGRITIQRVVKMPLLDINDVMRRHFQGAPAFLSIDTEGLDLAILKGIDFDRFRPPIICVETLVSNTRKTRPEIPAFLATRGYVVRGGSFVNTIFIDSKRV